MNSIKNSRMESSQRTEWSRALNQLGFITDSRQLGNTIKEENMCVLH